MNNWRLLLLAVVAVFQPIASFTDSYLIDGRQQCCERVSSAPLQDTRSSLHGTSWLDKATSALRLNDRDETRKYRRYELRQLDSLFSRPSTGRPLVDFRARVATQVPSEITRFSRVEHRLERPTISSSRERLLDGLQGEETPRSIRYLKHQDLSRRVVDRTSRDALERRNDRVSTESPRNRLFRNDERSGNGRLSKSLNSQREMQRDQIRSVERRITLNRDARRDLSRSQDEVSVEDSNNMNNRQLIARERMSAVRCESSIRPDTRRYSEHTDERRDLQRSNEQRHSLTENTRLVNRIRDTRKNLQRIRTIQRLSTDRSDKSREQREDRRQFRQQNKENIFRSASGERRMQVARRITREARIMNDQNKRNVHGQQEIRHERMSRDFHYIVRDNPDHRISHERILTVRRNIRESRIMNTQNKREVVDRRQIRDNERMTRETRDENRENSEERLSRERTQMARRHIRESKLIIARNMMDVADRREIRDNERVARETRNENRENPEQRLSHERSQMNRRDIRESRLNSARNTRDVADRREIRENDRITRETRDENRLSRERIQMNRRDIRESRLINARNTRDVTDRREIRDNNRMTRATRDENRENPEQRLSRERIQMNRRDIRESRLINARNTRDVTDRREIRDNNRMTRATRDENRENPEQRLSRERIQMNRRDIRESRLINARNTRDVTDRREIRDNDRMTRETWDENRENPEQRLSRERIQMNQRYIRESRNTLSVRNADDRREVRDTERNTRDERENHINRLSVARSQVDRRNIHEFKVINNVVSRDDDRRIDSKRESRFNNRISREIREDENTENREERLSREKIQMDRRNIREFRNMRIITRTMRDVEGQRQIRIGANLHTENRKNPDHRLPRERIVTDRRNTRDSREDFDRRQEIRESREARKQMRENPDRRLARESRQVDRRNTLESRINRVATRNERSVDTESRREIWYNERLSEHIRERRVVSRSTDRINVERHSSIMDRRASSADRRNLREVRADPKLSLSTDSESRSEVFRSRVEHSHNIENRYRQPVVARSRNVERAHNRERNSVMVEKMESEGDFTVANWQYVLYTLQAAYLCALFMQMLTPRRNEKSHMRLRWLPASSHYKPIKVD